jgi:hypothetical protein
MHFLDNILNSDILEFMNFILDSDHTKSCDNLEHKGGHHHKKHKHKHKHKDKCKEHETKRHGRHIVKKLHEVTQQIQHKVSMDVQKNLEDYFSVIEPSSNPITHYLKPKMITFQLDAGRYVEVPKFTLVNHANVDLKQLNCVFRTDAKSMGIECDENFHIETKAVFEQNTNIDGLTKLNDLFVAEYLHPVEQDDIDIGNGLPQRPDVLAAGLDTSI